MSSLRGIAPMTALGSNWYKPRMESDRKKREMTDIVHTTTEQPQGGDADAVAPIATTG
ncbi:hypothetical protein [uncultured Roseibium sp.]|uniref:hypothetical protein n=1 Tax=uncultured Roseibium sp. TaxID=1936171 RepID=UPI0032163D5E